MGEKDSLKSKLSYLVSMSASPDEFSNPFEGDSNDVLDTKSFIDSTKTDKKKKKDKISEDIEKGYKLLEKVNGPDYSDDFDLYLDKLSDEDEDSTFKNSLVSLGRKFARDTIGTAEVSEYVKAYSTNEKYLSVLLDEVARDKIQLQKDIDIMRAPRSGRNFKALSELIAAKNSYHTTALQIVKELNSVKKVQFDLKNKADAKKAGEDGDSTMTSNRAIQSIFGLGRQNILGSTGGYEESSGALKDEPDQRVVDPIYYENDDEVIQRKFFSEDSSNDDGDKFLRYEKAFDTYVLIIDDTGRKTVIAEDKDGNIIPDYPLPKNASDLDFVISENTKTATDNYHRKYKVRTEKSFDE